MSLLSIINDFSKSLSICLCLNGSLCVPQVGLLIVVHNSYVLRCPLLITEVVCSFIIDKYVFVKVKDNRVFYYFKVNKDSVSAFSINNISQP